MLILPILLTALGVPPAQDPPRTDAGLIFAKGFEDANLTGRGWYDGNHFTLADSAGSGMHSIFKLNSPDMAKDRPNADAELRGSVERKPLIERTDVVFRSTDFPAMKFNQFLM